MIRRPEPFLFEAGPHAVILLHAYAGSSNDVRLLGRNLQKLGYTVYAPMFTGHATGEPKDILTKGSPERWWEDTQAAIAHLRERGYAQISIFGLSLGGVFATRALEVDPQLLGGGTFSSPVVAKRANNLIPEFLRLAKLTYKAEKVSDTEITANLSWINQRVLSQIEAIRDYSTVVAQELDQVQTPFFIAQGGDDDLIDAQDANLLRERLFGRSVSFHYYEGAGHVITVNSAKKQLEADLATFLPTLYH
ncbi:alpha/beta hydrolase [Secundilactobacillus kimchicus]|uniref:Esterase lipase n=1 Tax=Secundilactobacillus kimchicus JCM 15530 TaxID=1302272 RepID=A0A0R1HX22_9LACO|nr:alpha/beta fold hydrolase [Secundilactobacillus kimchicus]KRK48097.1 esterase lipase [Secundilactobacillus kimchicus JCM 15530]